MSSKQIQKLVLTSALLPLVNELGGYKYVKKRKDITSLLSYTKRGFAHKDEYADLVIVQRVLMLLDKTREKVAVVGRASEERKGEETVPRITSGASILWSHSPYSDAQCILDATTEHDGITIDKPRKRPDLVSVNDVKAGYVFLVRTVRTELKKILGGKEPDKTVQILSIAEAVEALNDKEMEKNFLSAATA